MAALKDNKGILTGPMPSASNELDDMLLRAMNNGWRHKAAGLLCCCLLFVAALRCEAQGNLIYNPSFELIDSCPTTPPFGAGFEHAPLGWFGVGPTPDYFNRCLPNGNVCSVPNNMGGWQQPVEGDAYAGMATYHHSYNVREMIGAELLAPLAIGATCYVSFYINAAAGGSEWPMMASSHFGALFTMDVEENLFGDPYPLRNFAQVYSEQVISDTAAWTLVSGSFVADSAYRYIVLGNHFDNDHTEADTIIWQDTIASNLYYSYTYVDQLCMSLDPEGCPVAQSVAERDDVLFAGYPNPATDVLRLTGVHAGESVQVFDGLGRAVWQQKAKGRSIEVGVQDWDAGCYVAVAHGTRSRRSFRFVLAER